MRLGALAGLAAKTPNRGSCSFAPNRPATATKRSTPQRLRLEGAANLCLRRRDWRAPLLSLRSTPLACKVRDKSWPAPSAGGSARKPASPRQTISRGTSDRSVLVHRNAFPVAALCIEATPRPLQALVPADFHSARCTYVVLWWEVSPVFTTD